MLEPTQVLSVVAALLGSLSILCLMEAITKLVSSPTTVSTSRRTTTTASSSFSKRIHSIRLPVVGSVLCLISYVYTCSHLQPISSSTNNMLELFQQSVYVPPPWALLHTDDGSWNVFMKFTLVLTLILILGTRYSLFFTAFFKHTVATTAVSSRTSLKVEDSTPAISTTTATNTTTTNADPSSPFHTPEIKLDMMYLATHLLPSSTHYDILFFISTTPSLLIFAKDTIERAEQLKKERLEFLKKMKKEKERRQAELTMFDTVLSSGGWADDDQDGDTALSSTTTDENSTLLDSDSNSQALKEAKEAKARAEREKELLAKQLAEATGKTSLAENVVLEEVDAGVLGQKWVEKTLAHVGQWPPVFIKKNPILGEAKFPMENSRNRTVLVTTMDHPGVKRSLCITAGRLNSQMLNTHTELVDASQNNRVDVTYFKTAVEFRQRASLILEGSLHLAASVKSYRLAKTLIETHVMFKVGVLAISHPQTIEWFRSTMASTYGGPEGIPALEFRSKTILTPDENEIATEDLCALELDIERKHADNFTRQKVELCAKQGIPPQIALSAYREIWWILIRAKNMDPDAPVEKLEVKPPQDGLAWFDKDNLSKYEKEPEENRLLHMFPFIVPNVAQKAGKLTVRFMAPKRAGKYKFFVDVKSGEFLGCDHEFTLVADVVDRGTVKRTENPKSETLQSTTESG